MVFMKAGQVIIVRPVRQFGSRGQDQQMKES